MFRPVNLSRRAASFPRETLRPSRNITPNRPSGPYVAEYAERGLAAMDEAVRRSEDYFRARNMTPSYALDVRKGV